MTRQTEITSGKRNAVSGNDAVEQTLYIETGETYRQPSQQYQLLLGFQFGSQKAPQGHPAIVNLDLKSLNKKQLTEAWWYKGPVKYSSAGAVKLAECQEYTVGKIQKDISDSEDFQDQTRQAYIDLIRAVRSTEHVRLVKMWNYFAEINEGEGDAEKYRQFSIGRAKAFQEMGVSDEESPTGTAIGTQGGGLVIIAIASNHPFCPVENPRQISAFQYPRKYGPESPKFCRAGFVSSDCHRLFLISGTAAVVGHESNFPDKTNLQTIETLNNLSQLCEVISSMESAGGKFTLDEQSILRVYLKDPDDYEWVSGVLGAKLSVNQRNVSYLQGTICRRELTVEIDGVKVV